jgi:5,10-methylenetetrahydromethanopterin reductase
MLAAMGPRMLELAGSRTDGTILWLSGPRTVDTVIRPAVQRAAAEAGRPDPRIVASVPVCVTDDGARVRDLIGQILVDYNTLPSYRAVMDIEGVAGPADVSLVGNEDEVRTGLERFAAAGTTDFSALGTTIPNTYRAGQPAGDNWDTARATLNAYDPHRVFSNGFVDTLLP